MNKHQKIIIFLFILIIIFFLGIIFGAFLANRYIYEAPVNSSLIKNTLNTEFILTATISGKVKKILENNIILEQNENEQTVSVHKDAQILFSLMEKDPSTGNLISGTPVEKKFNDIKVNDLVTITLVKEASGNLIADKVYIFMSED